MADWQVDLAAFSETSHTSRAVASIRSEFKRQLDIVWLLVVLWMINFLFGQLLVPFVANPVVLQFLLGYQFFSFEDERVSACVWASSRLVHTVVQVGHLPVHVLVAYLHPCAHVGSEKFEVNTRIMAAAASVLEGLHGPALLVGDWNAPAESFEPVRQLQAHFGYKDVALLVSERLGVSPEPTCKGATRHSFIYASPDAVRFVQSCWVGAHFDLDSHSVLFAQFSFPSGNPSVLKWIAPVSLDTAEVDTEAANLDIDGITDTLVECVADLLDQDDLDGAIATWSDCVETHLLEHANPKHPVKRYKGRCQSCEPRSVRLGPPRLKGGRPSDFCPSVYSGSVQVRQWTKTGAPSTMFVSCLRRC